jgi:threonine synthase
VPLTHLDCTRCNQRYEPGQILTVCTVDGAPLFARYDLERAAKNMRPGHLALREPTLWRYDDVLPVDSPDHRVSLGEGFTPLLTARRLGSLIGLPRLFIKDESGEPTGSFKARGLSLAVSMAKALGATDVCLPSAGNAGSALAAYAAKGGLKAHVFVPKDIAQLFLMETRAYGAEVETVDGLITDAGKVCAERAKENGWYECATLKEPYRVEGKKTMGYELAEQMGWKLPDAILYPTGGGTGLIGMWKAFFEMRALGWPIPHIPRLISVQMAGCAPVVRGFTEGATATVAWADPKTRVWGLRVPSPLGGFLCLRAVRETYGTALAIPEADAAAATSRLAARTGLDICPEGGAAFAAYETLRERGDITATDTVVVFNTGTGLKYR